MNLVERYLHEVGRYLPRKTREDILVELRSTITDTLEERGQEEAGEENVVRLLKELGEPRKLAASYSGNAQYLIGPELYPLFRMIAGIVVAAVIGAQLLAYGIAVGVGEPLLNPWESLAGILSSIPAALGWLVITFAILQRTNVRPKIDDEAWDPRSLPEIEEAKTVKPAEHIFSIIAGSVILAILTFFPEIIGVVILPKGDFFANPVILQYLGIISISLIAGICLDIYLLWQGKWNTISRIAQLAVNAFSIMVLAILLQGHNAWLAERGYDGFLLFFPSSQLFNIDFSSNWQVIGMEAFRLAFAVALIVTSVEVIVRLYRLVRFNLSKNSTTLEIR